MKNFFLNKWFKFIMVSIAYLLWVIWNGNYWWLLVEIAIFDIYITGKVHWAFWKKKGVKKQTRLVEWIDALIFAVIAASFIRTYFIEAFTIPTSSMEKSLLVGDYLFVSKVSYGPRKPVTPVAFPFVHHTLPFTKSAQSFSTVVQWPYERIKGFTKIKNNDVVVFNFPEGDTVVVQHQDQSYYQMCRNYGRKAIWDNFDITVRPVDKRENYIKRCVAIHGDTLRIEHGQVYVNGKAQIKLSEMQYKYLIRTDGTRLNPKILQKIGISMEDMDRSYISNNEYLLPLTELAAGKLKGYSNVISMTRIDNFGQDGSDYIFPHNKNFKWNEDNFGPICIPAKGVTINLDVQNLPLYQRLISLYEGNDLQVVGSKIIINGVETSTYTFKMDYYWMMGDSRHNSQDSRFWGFVPEDHIVGKAAFIWLSLDKDKKFLSKIRWKRFFKGIE